MFNGIHKEVNAALDWASGLIIESPLKSEKKLIEIELRLKSYGAGRGEGVGDQDAFERAMKRGMREVVMPDAKQWSVIKRVDTVTSYTNGYRSIEETDKLKVFQQKVTEAKNGVILKEYNGLLGVAVEFDLDGFPPGTGQEENSRRVRDRTSFVYKSAEDPTLRLRVDFTIVQSTVNNKDRKHYEVEIEASGNFPRINTDAKGNLLLNSVQQKMDQIATVLYRYINETPIIYSTEIRQSLIGDINTIAVGQREKTEVNRILDSWINKPRPLERRDLSTGSFNSMFPASPKDDPLYSVTIKTDGRRVIACWHETGLYLCSPFSSVVTRIMKWNSAEEESGMAGTILDCELIETGCLAEQKEFKLYIFDCMFVKAQGQIVDIRQKPLETRLAMARFVVYSFGSPQSDLIIKFEVKQFITFVDRTTFYEANKTALKLNMRGGVELFRSDGLVFTDRGIYLSGERSSCGCKGVEKRNCSECASFNATKNLKYKEIVNLTVDFLIKINRDSQKTINTADTGERFAHDGFRPFTGNARFPTQATQFLDSIDIDGKQKTLEEDQIVEMRWDRDPLDNQFKWIPVRIRADRPSANKTNVAITNWNLINDPIPLGLLKGVLKGRKVLQLMYQYHNRIKMETLEYWNREILARFQREGKNTVGNENPQRPVLLDVGSGKGGDVEKWRQTAFEVIALEPDNNVLGELRERAAKAGISGRISIINGKIQDTALVTNKMRAVPLLQEADLIASFFSMTLIFESAQSVQNFVNTVKETIAPNGIFVCAALDGKAVNRILGDKKQLSVEGIKIQRGDTPRDIWIRFPAADQRIAQGQHEFLVDFDFLITLMEAAGFELIKDVYLDSEVVLNNSELFYSQLNRLIEMRYIGLKKEPQPSKRLMELVDIMKTIRVPRPEIDQFQKIQPELCAELGETNWVTIGVLGGGSCFLHSILWSIYQPYRTMQNNDRFTMVSKLRLELATNFTHAVYDSINNGHLKSFGDNAGSVYSYASLREGLSDYTYWFGLEFLTFVQDQLNINVHILWIENGALQFYRFAPDRAITFKPERNNILLFWEGQNHFQPMGRVLSNNMASFVFPSDDKIITSLKK
uniref:mRNA cap 0 methyltransferase domain-containing protein n=1 Tax=viral metagenome TaxID=1070528 RepID=A0A6C0CID1_9ZZZZ